MKKQLMQVRELKQEAAVNPAVEAVLEVVVDAVLLSAEAAATVSAMHDVRMGIKKNVLA